MVGTLNGEARASNDLMNLRWHESCSSGELGEKRALEASFRSLTGGSVEVPDYSCLKTCK